MVIDRALIFRVSIPWGKTFSLVPKVIYQGQDQISRSHEKKKQKPLTLAITFS